MSRLAAATSRLRGGRPGIRVHPGCRLRAAPSASIDARGRLDLGITWPQGRHYPCHVVLREGASLRVSGDFQVHTDCRVWVNEGAALALGSGYANAGLNLSVFESVSIGAACAIAEHVTIRDSDSHELSGASKPSTAPIVIGDRVWIGTGATVLKGVRIGDGAVVAAGAVVVHDVPPGALVAGVPARVVRTDVTWS